MSQRFVKSSANDSCRSRNTLTDLLITRLVQPGFTWGFKSLLYSRTLVFKSSALIGGVNSGAHSAHDVAVAFTRFVHTANATVVGTTTARDKANATMETTVTVEVVYMVRQRVVAPMEGTSGSFYTRVKLELYK